MCDHILHFRKEAGSLFEQALAGQGAAGGKYGFCGGRGACGKCRVRFPANAPLPSAADRKFLTPEQLRGGFRLACTAKPAADCDVELCFDAGPDMEIVTVSNLEKAANGTSADGIAAESTAESMASGSIAADGKATGGEAAGGGRFCAVDLGTTTVVMQLIERETGSVSGTRAFPNPQRAYGVDVLARIAAAESGAAGRLRNVLLTELENGLRALERKGKADSLVIAGNTTMGHLLLGYPAGSLGRAPFTPYHIGSTYFDLSGHPAVFLPGISAFVGADIVSGIYACGMAEREELSLLIDLGTNGEMAIGNRDGILCTATAAGSAFEGGVSAQAAGTDVTALAYDMLAAGVMDESGLLREPWFTDGYPAGGITIRQQDIRNLQMAKAAICAGAALLLDRTQGWDALSHVYLAGGFGYYLDVEKAAGIGLIPDAIRGKCAAVGNASLAGAVMYGRNEGNEEMAKLRHIADISRSVNLAEQPEFEARYIDAMAFKQML